MNMYLKKQLQYLFLFIGLFIAKQINADPGNGIVADKNGNIFYTDLSQVFKIDALGKKTVVVPGVHTHELYMDGAGNLFGEHLWYNGEASNTWGHYVWKRNVDGKVVKVKNDSPGFLEWYSFVRDDSGNMYYAEQSIPYNFWKISPAGERALLGSLSIRQPGRLHISKKGDLYFSNKDAIYKIPKNDTLRLFINNLSADAKTNKGKQCERCIESTWTDSADNLYVAFSADLEVLKFDREGKAVAVHRTTGEWYPVGGTFAANGRLWVLEYNNKNETRCVPAGEMKTAVQELKQRSQLAGLPGKILLGAVIVLLAGWLISRRKRPSRTPTS
jgi:hypothetical protein